MTHESRPTSTQHAPTSRRRLGVAIGAVAAAVVLLIASFVLWPRAEEPAVNPPNPSGSAAPAFERPAGGDPFRPAVHLTPERQWMNDPQRPFLVDGVWHFYYLYNADHPEGNGTAWYHATSTDLVHWVDQGVAIDKYTNGLGDIWTGTAVVDRENTAGFGEDAVVAVVTQQSDGVQRQSLFVSRDGGYRFEPYEGNPVMQNPGVADFRDPRVLWDEEHGAWVMALAEGGKIGFYTSPDLKDWTYVSAFQTADLGVLECPDLFEMSLDGDPTKTRWVLAAGANGAAEGMSTGTLYWVGDWDGQTFTPDDPDHQWLDRGADYYAAVTWDDPRLPREERLRERYGMGWLNNWAYAGKLPSEEWHGGAQSLVRSIRLVSNDDRATLESTPIDALRDLDGPAERLDAATVVPGEALDLPVPGSDAYRVTVDLAVDELDDGELRIRVPRGADGEFATVGYDLATGTAFVARDADAIAADMPEAYRAIHTAPAPPREGRVRLDVIVDVTTVEVFVNDGAASLSMVTAGAGAGDSAGLRLEAVRTPVRVTDAVVTPLRTAPVKRAE